MGGRRLVLVYRTARNPDFPETIDSTTFLNLTWRNGYNQAHAVDLLEECPPGSGYFLPVGHVDARVMRPSDKSEVLANSNITASRSLMDKGEGHGEGVVRALQVADRIWGNGIDVLDNLNTMMQAAGDDDSLKVLLRHAPSPLVGLVWRNKDLGKLLMGLNVEMLKQLGVDRLDFQHAFVSPSFSPILGKVARGEKMIRLSQVPQQVIDAFVSPFIPKGR
jgi:hypothetical protein